MFQHIDVITMSSRFLEYIEALAQDCPRELTPREEFILLGIDPCGYYFAEFRKNSYDDAATGQEIFGDSPEKYARYDTALLAACPELRAIARYNCNRNIYEA